ncbi:GNAT family N-acetyltransferase [Lactobacillus crispatus]|uniref:GNAT family N-acetyltransferase n=1 Tax=Lactobacillus crispatus TaxID=47770 RepID=A0AB37DHC4_9LACO|nr:GNAT family N-acetyltransferase [Lactobacillus crispatus]OCX09511.1 GNAT family N-acetyltransferase [Lactobacillus crispatus]QHQ68207.1 GNAT family N-acetyltransferase [Lactobacillus crispatus]
MQIKEIIKLNQSTEQELLTIWESSVRATHKFLNNDEILQIRNYVPQAFKQVEHLLIIIDHEQIKGFMGINDQKVEMLFIDAQTRSKGYGSKLLNYGIQIDELAVNEQNPQAVGFYEHMGFKVVERSATDDQGNPYPILRMKLDKEK